jgi:hypothetical protein
MKSKHNSAQKNTKFSRQIVVSHHNHKTNNPLSSSQPFNVFISTFLASESQLGEVWKSSNTISLFPNPFLPVWFSLTSVPLISTLDSRFAISPDQVTTAGPFLLARCVPRSSRTLNIKAQRYSETSVTIHQSARRHIPVDMNVQHDRCENLRSHNTKFDELRVVQPPPNQHAALQIFYQLRPTTN